MIHNTAVASACLCVSARRQADTRPQQGEGTGVVVTAVEPDSGAEKAGVMRGDVILEINRHPVKSVKDFEKVSSGLKKGENVLIFSDPFQAHPAGRSTRSPARPQRVKIRRRTLCGTLRV